MTAPSKRTSWLAGAAAIALVSCGGEERAQEPQSDLTLTEAGSDKVDEVETADQAFDRIVEEAMTGYLELNPLEASSLNVSEELAGGRYKDRLGTPGIAGYEENRAFFDAIEAELAAIDASALTGKRAEWLAILLSGRQALQEMQVIAEEAGYYLAGEFWSPYIATQIAGVHIDLPQAMTTDHALRSRDDAEAYVARLELFYDQFEGEIELMRANAEAGVIPPDYAVDGAINNAAKFIAMPPEENPLIVHLADSIEGLGIEGKDEILEDAVAAAESSVYPAYEALLSALRSYQDRATPDAGIWDIPSGSELYGSYVEVNGESTLSPAAIHELGLREVERIHAEMETIFETIGMREGSVGARLAALTADPEQVFPNTQEGREELLDYVRQLAAEASDVMDEYFLQTPRSEVEVRPVPSYAEEGAPGGYYNAPAIDGSRPGLYFINLRNTATQPKFSLPTLTYHEAVPGHHFQIALMIEAEETPLAVRQLGSSTGFIEGWALYSEKFAEEIGLYEDDPLGDLGRLRDELFRAVRLVVDSGMHHKRWSRDEAIDYMVENAGMEPSGVKIEIERYSVWPGQALAYKTGMLRIQELRSRAEKALGEDFDLATFHYEVLRDGGAPLAVLEERVDAWIEEGGPRPS